MNRRYVSAAINLVDLAGVNAMFRLMNRTNAVILTYHGVCSEDFTQRKDYNERHVPVGIFRQHLSVLRKSGFTFATLSDLVYRIKCGQAIDRVAVLTFDDGFRNVVRNAYPVMKEFGAKGCFFVVSNFIGSRTLLWTDFVETYIRDRAPEPLLLAVGGKSVPYYLNSPAALNFAIEDLKRRLRSMPNEERIRWMEESGMVADRIVDKASEEFYPADWQDLQSLDRSVLEIGSHTQNHPNCDTISSASELDAEIAGSKIEIERRIGRKIEHFCYPAGAFNPAVIETVRRAGFQSAVTTIEGFTTPGADLFTLQRIFGDSDLTRFKATVSGSLPWIQRSAQVLRGAT